MPDNESVLDAVSSGNHDTESIELAAGLSSQRSAQILRVRYMRKRDTGRSAS